MGFKKRHYRYRDRRHSKRKVLHSTSKRLTVEFLVGVFSRNIELIFLITQGLSLLGLLDFNLNPSHFPNLRLASEFSLFKSFKFNPFFIYGRYFQIFYLMGKGFVLSFVDSIKHSLLESSIISVLVVNIWLLYSKIKYGAKGQKENIKDVLRKMGEKLEESNLIERSLWMMFLIDAVVFVITPSKVDIFVLAGIYFLIASVKFLPGLSRAVINLSIAFENSFMEGFWVVALLSLLDIIVLYFDDSRLFVLFVMIVLYNLTAVVILYVVERFLGRNNEVYKYLFYTFNIATIFFFLCLMSVYFAAYVFVLFMQLPVLLYVYSKEKKWKISPKFVHNLNLAILAVLLFVYFL